MNPSDNQALNITTPVMDKLEYEKLDVLGRLDSLEAALLTNDPCIPVHLKAIKESLNKHEELIHLLDDSKVRILMQGMKKYVGAKLVETAIATKTSRRSSLKNTTVDDI